MSAVVVYVPADAPSIQAAMDQHVGVSLEIVLESGHYEESLRLSGDIQLRSGSTQRVELVGQHIVVGGTVLLEGLHLQGFGASPTLSVQGGEARLYDCIVDAASARFVDVSGKGTVLTIEQSDLQHGDTVGILVTDGARLEARQMVCGQTSDDVLVVRRDASASLESCTIHPSGQAGLWAHQNSRVEILQCRFFQHPNNNIQAQGHAQVRVTDSQLHHGGVSVDTHAHLEGHNLTLVNAAQSLVLLQRHGTVNLEDCRLQGGDYGVFIEDGCRATLTRSLLQDCRYALLVVESHLTATQCCFMDSPQLLATSTPKLVSITEPLTVNCQRMNNIQTQRPASLPVPGATHHQVSPSQRRRRVWRDRLLQDAIRYGSLHLIDILAETCPAPKDLEPFLEAAGKVADPVLRERLLAAVHTLRPVRRRNPRPADADHFVRMLTDEGGARRAARELRTRTNLDVVRWLVKGCRVDESGVLHSGATLRKVARQRAVQVTVLLELVPLLSQHGVGDPSLHIDNLHTLSLEGCGLSELPAGLFEMTRLRRLILKDNRIRMIGPGIGRLQKLQNLDLQLNRLTALPEVIGQLSELLKLDVADNALKALPDSIGQLVNLRTLDANRNQLTGFPETIRALQSLQQLWMSNNRIAVVQDCVRDLHGLTSIHLFNNPIQTFPEHLLTLPLLKKLELGRTHISKWPEPSRLPEGLVLLNGD